MYDCHMTVIRPRHNFFYSVPKVGELGASVRVGGHPLQGRRRRRSRRRVHLYGGGRDTGRAGCEIQWT